MLLSVVLWIGTTLRLRLSCLHAGSVVKQAAWVTKKVRPPKRTPGFIKPLGPNGLMNPGVCMSPFGRRARRWTHLCRDQASLLRVRDWRPSDPVENFLFDICPPYWPSGLVPYRTFLVIRAASAACAGSFLPFSVGISWHQNDLVPTENGRKEPASTTMNSTSGRCGFHRQFARTKKRGATSPCQQGCVEWLTKGFPDPKHIARRQNQHALHPVPVYRPIK
jgi:hypothetical protein